MPNANDKSAVTTSLGGAASSGRGSPAVRRRGETVPVLDRRARRRHHVLHGVAPGGVMGSLFVLRGPGLSTVHLHEHKLSGVIRLLDDIKAGNAGLGYTGGRIGQRRLQKGLLAARLHRHVHMNRQHAGGRAHCVAFRLIIGQRRRHRPSRVGGREADVVLGGAARLRHHVRHRGGPRGVVRGRLLLGGRLGCSVDLDQAELGGVLLLLDDIEARNAGLAHAGGCVDQRRRAEGLLVAGLHRHVHQHRQEVAVRACSCSAERQRRGMVPLPRPRRGACPRQRRSIQASSSAGRCRPANRRYRGIAAKHSPATVAGGAGERLPTPGNGASGKGGCGCSK
mmetsp:Transcript_23418/g.60061  ORF Transcript_23418/g.60061 Transcript_23418/m.60061 type:complete len:338 (+) Transcript_23418:171-1184(+)